MKKIPKDANWHYLKWLGIAVVSILLFGIIYHIDKSVSTLSMILRVSITEKTQAQISF